MFISETDAQSAAFDGYDIVADDTTLAKLMIGSGTCERTEKPANRRPGFRSAMVRPGIRQTVR
jgi:hypothetical protein